MAVVDRREERRSIRGSILMSTGQFDFYTGTWGQLQKRGEDGMAEAVDVVG